MTGNITKFASRFTPSFQPMSGIHGVLEAHVDAQRHRAARRAAAAARGATQGAHAMLVLQSQTWRMVEGRVKTMGKCGKTIGKPWENGDLMGKPEENHGKMVISW